MSIKPCPACEAGHDGEWTHGIEGPQLACGICGLRGPCGDDHAAAERRWNAMPRRGDGPAWRSEPPDQLGWWYRAYQIPGLAGWHPVSIHVDAQALADPKFSETNGYKIRWAGPFSESPDPDTEKEAAK